MDKVTQFTKITHSPHFGMHQFFYENNNGTLISVCFSDIFWAQLFLSTLSIYQFKNLSVFFVPCFYLMLSILKIVLAKRNSKEEFNVKLRKPPSCVKLIFLLSKKFKFRFRMLFITPSPSPITGLYFFNIVT